MQEFISSRRNIQILGFLGLILATIVLLIASLGQTNLFGRAAEPDKLETEGGTLSSTGVQKLSDSLASGGQYVLFANATNTPTPTPITSPNTPTPGPTSSPPPPGLRAFPEAEGFGKNTKGGRGGRVIYVTNLNDTGAGSFREALQATGPRTVVFKVAGTIDLNSDITIKNPFLTIAGQTAPGEGVQIKGGMLMVNTHEIIIRYLKLRSGDEEPPAVGGDRDSMTIKAKSGTNQVYNIIIDHSELIWGPDIGSLAIMWDTHDVTVQNSILGEGLLRSNHIEASRPAGHSKGINVPHCCGGEDISATKLSFYQNLLTTSDDRMPQFQRVINTDFVNNVVYNWGQFAGTGAPRSLNLIKNFFIKGPESKANAAWIPGDSLGTIFDNAVFASGNALEGISIEKGGSASVYASTRFSPYSIINEKTPQAAYDWVVPNVGPNKQIANTNGDFRTIRDSVSTRIVNNLLTRQGQFLNGVDSPAPNIFWPNLSSGPVATDSDNDGMADSWENANFGNLSRGSATNSSSDFDGDGYTDLEEYLNSTNPKLSN